MRGSAPGQVNQSTELGADPNASRTTTATRMPKHPPNREFSQTNKPNHQKPLTAAWVSTQFG